MRCTKVPLRRTSFHLTILDRAKRHLGHDTMRRDRLEILYQHFCKQDSQLLLSIGKTYIHLPTISCIHSAPVNLHHMQ
jgi:hypothetical protein